MCVPSIWTAIYDQLPLPAALRALHEVGWRCFEMSTEHLGAIEAADRPMAVIEETLQTLDALHSAMPQAHGCLAAVLYHPAPSQHAANVATLQRNLHTCAQLGIRHVVMHPGSGEGYADTDERQRLLAGNIDSLRRLSETAVALGLGIAVENMMDHNPVAGRRRFGETAEDLHELLAAVDAPANGITLDTSHAHVVTEDVAAFVRALGPAVCCTHISDNNRSGDQHLTPGYGTIDWPPVLTALSEIGYAGAFNLEIPGARHANIDIRTQKVRHAFEMTQWLLQQTPCVAECVIFYPGQRKQRR